MFNLCSSELWFYGGIAAMAASAVMGLACMAVFIFTGRRIRKKLEQEYGSPWQ